MKLLKTTAIAGLIAASGAASAVELSGNVALTTDYVWRGISQTEGAPAVQGGFDAAFDNGLYVGVWGSNVDIYSDATMEFDTYVGWAGEFSGVGVDVGFISYHYPTAANGNNSSEGYVGLSFGPVALTYYAGLDLGNEDISDTNWGDYTDLSLDLGEFEGIGFSANVAHYDYRGADNYQDWKLAAVKNFMDVDLELAYVGNNADASHSAIENDIVTFTVSKSL